MKFKRGDEVKITDNEGKPMDAIYMRLSRRFNDIRVHEVRFFKKDGNVVKRPAKTPPFTFGKGGKVPKIGDGWHTWYILESRFLPKEGL